jgi:hypothetical protein
MNTITGAIRRSAGALRACLTMGRMTALCLLALVTLASGCVTVVKNPPATQPIGATTQPSQDKALQLVAQKVTLGYIIASDDPRAAARRVIAGATLAKQQASDLGVDISDLRHFVIQQIAPRFPQIDPLRLMAGADLIITSIEELQGIDVSVQILPSDALPRTRALINLAADAAIAAAQPYAG